MLPRHHNLLQQARSYRRFSRSESGAVTVENVLWLPFFILMTFALVDFGLMFNAQARALSVAQDGLRNYSTGYLADTDAANTWIETRLGNISPNAVAETTDGISDNILSVRVTIPTDDIDGFGIFAALNSTVFVIETEMFQEFQQ